MGCCESTERPDSIKKDKQQLEGGFRNNVINDNNPSSPSAGTRNKVQPLPEDNKTSLVDSKSVIL